MTDTRWVRPLAGRRVRTPAKGAPLLAAAGAQVAWSSYWQRLLSSGDVEVFVPAVPAPAAPSPTKAAPQPPAPAPSAAKDA